MNLDGQCPAFPQSLAVGPCGDVYSSADPGYGHAGMDITTLAALEFTKVHLADLMQQHCGESAVSREIEACVRGWETAGHFVAAAATLKETVKCTSKSAPCPDRS